MGADRVYLDWNAGAPLRAEVAARLVEAMGRAGNASSVHAEGRAARALVEAARRQVAVLVGGDPRFVTFTSGGTEAAVTVLTPQWTFGGKPLAFDRLLVSAVEHPCVARGGRFPAERVETIPVDGDGLVDLAALDARLAEIAASGQRALVSVMFANNETGAIQPVADVSRIAHGHGALVHTDVVQAVGRIPVSIADLGVDVLTLSAHKIGGPQGAGAIVRATDLFAFQPLLIGGGQESHGRAGTENVWAIHGFGLAAEAAGHDLKDVDAVRARRDRIEAFVRSAAPAAMLFASGVTRVPNTVAFAVPGLSAETALIALDLSGVSVSSGSACSSGKVGASPVLTAMGVAPDFLKGALRVSLGPTTSDDDVVRFIEVFGKVLADLTKRQGTRAA